MNRQCYTPPVDRLSKPERDRLGIREGQTHTHRNKGKVYDRRGKR